MTQYSELRAEKRIDLMEHSPLLTPLSVYIEPTNICNFKCLYCPESFANFKERSGGLYKLSQDDFEKIVQEIKSIGKVKTINFYMMGEPFANQKLCDFIRMAKEYELAERLIVTSNGSLLRPKLYDLLANSGLDYLRISIYGGNEESHRKRTNSLIKLNEILDNVLGFKLYRDSVRSEFPRIYIKMIDSLDEVENSEFISLFSAAADEICLEPPMNWNDPAEGNLALQPIDHLLATNYFKNKKKACPLPFYSLVIHSDLRVSVCCVDWAKQAVVGDLKKQTLKSIWFGSSLHEFRIKHLRGEREEIEACKRCTYLYTLPDNIDSMLPEAFEARYIKYK